MANMDFELDRMFTIGINLTRMRTEIAKFKNERAC